MLAGYIKPFVIRIVHSRIRYRFWDLMEKDLPVICYDMKSLIVGDAEFIRCYRILWKDVKLVESERVTQVSIVQSVSHSKVVDRRREKKPFFKAGAKNNA
jgi:hypothetical protein